MRRFLIALALSLLAAGHAWAGEEEEVSRLWGEPILAAGPDVGKDRAGAKYRLWFAELGGDVQVDGLSLEGSEIRIDSDLGLNDGELFNDICAWIQLPVLGSVRGSYWFGEFEDSETLDQAFTFSDVTFAAGTSVESMMEIEVATLLLDVPILSPGAAGVATEVAFQVGGKHLSAHGMITDEATGSSQADSLRGALPVVGVRAQAAFGDYVRVELEGNGLALRYSDKTIRIMDVTLEAIVTPWEGAFVGVGYHMAQLSGEDKSTSREEIEADIILQGVYVTVGWRF